MVPGLACLFSPLSSDPGSQWGVAVITWPPAPVQTGVLIGAALLVGLPEGRNPHTDQETQQRFSLGSVMWCKLSVPGPGGHQAR